MRISRRLTAALPGNRPEDVLLAQRYRPACYDGRVGEDGDLGPWSDRRIAPLVSGSGETRAPTTSIPMISPGSPPFRTVAKALGTAPGSRTNGPFARDTRDPDLTISEISREGNGPVTGS
ncbi:hypothetical protein GCM10009754_04840 [Amycolatopsis minnesotensis]|uniref:Uncharacterized protein n=1 Tax=Amycolatopsis minnesotensis TaxID=337894 RepID=A0ABP5BCF3_9PSEU